VWALVVTLFVGGCGLTAQERATIGAFAQATTALGDASGEAFVAMREDTIALTGSVLELGNPVGASVSPDDLDRALDPDDVAARVLATRALADYGDLLAALASGELDLRSQNAALSLKGSLDALHERGTIDLAAEKRSAIGGILSRIAGGIVEAQTASAIREVVPATAPAIDRLCDLLVADFDDGGAGFASQVLVARSDAITAARVVESQLPSLADDPSTAPLRERIVSVYGLASSAGARTEATGALVREAVEALRDANSNLKTSVDSGGALTIDRLESLVIRVREFVALVEVVADD
jgi:hypothetical protein